MTILTVSQLNKYISFKLKEDSKLRGIFVRGEISNLRGNGHMYFTIKDETSLIRAVMFSSNAQYLKFRPENGMRVLIMGSVNVYEKDGAYQLYVTDMQPDGQGLAQAEFEKLRRELSEQGLFDESHKLSLPAFPEKIGVVTSVSGAAVRDIINVIGRRYPLTQLYLFNTLVQGIHASENIMRSLSHAADSGCDLIILGRGGGSSEDLSAFNDKDLAYCIYSLEVPVISAVGHETDFTIADFVSDMRAPTPSAAAELAVPSVQEIAAQIEEMKLRMTKACRSSVDRNFSRLHELSARLAAVSPQVILEKNKSEAAVLTQRLSSSFAEIISSRRVDLGELCARLSALNPMNVLSRGYAVVRSTDDTLVRNAQDLKNDDVVSITFSDGSVNARIINGTVK
ncbi:MAG: exodeoxyribonuclease VII large subunit [Oscillospiraceae bacterium]|nr:exodeoxyribonuclease VII large subunit [Oscillospiraceae bacterium]